MVTKLVIERNVLNVISTCARQLGLHENVKMNIKTTEWTKGRNTE